MPRRTEAFRPSKRARCFDSLQRTDLRRGATLGLRRTSGVLKSSNFRGLKNFVNSSRNSAAVFLVEVRAASPGAPEDFLRVPVVFREDLAVRRVVDFQVVRRVILDPKEVIIKEDSVVPREEDLWVPADAPHPKSASNIAGSIETNVSVSGLPELQISVHPKAVYPPVKKDSRAPSSAVT